MNNTYIIVAACSAMAIIGFALRATPLFAIAAMMILAVICLAAMFGNWWIAHAHPDQAMTGGAQFAGLRALQMNAKDVPQISSDKPVNPRPIVDVSE